MPETIAVAGALARRPGAGGHAWVFLQYLLGFRRLGFEVLFLDRIEPEACVDGRGRPSAFQASRNAQFLHEVMRYAGLERSYSLSCADDFAGLSRRDVCERLREASVLLNVNGYLQYPELLGAARRRVYLDIDPGFPQMWRALALHDAFAGHDAFATVGLNIGREDCLIPTCGLDWVSTLQPVVLDEWPFAPGEGSRFTSVCAWRGPWAPIEYGGRTFGLRAHEFRRFAALPGLAGRRFELALDIDEADAKDRRLLEKNGWALADPQAVAGSLHAYRSYLQHSRAEFAVAKNLYVDSRSGWFSDRSVCYLASGRPVLAQDTGLRRWLPEGQGLLLFSTRDEAAAGVEEIARGYQAHRRAARQIAEECFDSAKVLPRLLDAVHAPAGGVA